MIIVVEQSLGPTATITLIGVITTIQIIELKEIEKLSTHFMKTTVAKLFTPEKMHF